MAKTTEINQAIGYAIKEGLARKHMTQSELAGIVGSTQRSISSYVTGNTQPPLDILTHICLTLEINMNQILLIPEFHNPHRIVTVSYTHLLLVPWIKKPQLNKRFLSKSNSFLFLNKVT